MVKLLHKAKLCDETACHIQPSDVVHTYAQCYSVQCHSPWILIFDICMVHKRLPVKLLQACLQAIYKVAIQKSI